jgi:hypothetical protein
MQQRRGDAAIFTNEDWNMIGEISAVFNSIRAAQDIAKGLVAVRDRAKLEAAVSQINSRN